MRLAARRVAVVAVATSVCLGASQFAWADSDTGTGAPSVDNSASTIVYSDQETAQINAGSAEVDAIGALMAAGAAVTNHCVPDCPTRSYSAAPATIHWEGEGDTDPYTGNPKYYTCGPAATRNLLEVMGAGDPSENTLANWEGTDKPTAEGGGGTGTSIAGIRQALTNHYSSFGTWSTVSPGSQNGLMSHVVEDVYALKRPIVTNVATVYLPFWNGAAKQHYDLISGYNWDANTLEWTEEWNTHFNGLWGTSSDYYGDPHGVHPNVPVSDGFDAVVSSPSHSFVFASQALKGA